MRPVEYLRLLRQRWWVLPVAALVGLLVALATEPAAPKPVDLAPLTSYTATHVVVSKPIGTNVSPSINYDRLAIIASSGAVPANTSETLDLGPQTPFEPPFDARLGPPNPNNTGYARGVSIRPASVVVTPNQITGSLTIAATAPSPTLAAATANALAAELIIYLNPPVPVFFGQSAASYGARLNALQSQHQAVLQQLEDLRTRLFIAIAQGHSADSLRTGIRQASLRLVDVDRGLLQLTQSQESNSPLISLSVARPSTATAAFGALPKEAVVKAGWPRLLVGAAIGLGAGIALLLLLEVLRPRVRDIRSAEGAALMPVVAEISAVPISRDERYRVIAAEEPSSLLAEAYRTLRTSILAMWPRHPVNAEATRNGGSPAGLRPLRTLLVTSPGAGEGKSLSTANLAAAFAETGATVIVLDADARRPTLHRYFGARSSPNLGDLGPDLTPSDLSAVLQDTTIAGVRMAASARGTAPARAVSVVKAAANAAVHLADVVILDSPPLLVANDSAELASAADATVLLVRAGRTARDSAVRGAGLLRRIEAPVVGVVLIGVEHSAPEGFYGYDSYYGGAEQPRRHGRFRRRSGRRAKRSAARAKASARPSQAARQDFVDLVAEERARPEDLLDLTSDSTRADRRRPRSNG